MVAEGWGGVSDGPVIGLLDILLSNIGHYYHEERESDLK